MAIDWKLVEIYVSDITPQTKNPRRLSKEEKNQLSKSLDSFGVVEPIVINTDGTLIGGHQRFNILKSQGHKNIKCMMPHRILSEKEVDELTIRLNKNHGEFDFDLLANGYEPEDLISWGFTMEELHLESIPENQKPKTCQLTAKFENEDDLREAEKDIAAIIDKYASASYKVKIK